MDLLEEIGNHEENKTIIFAETKRKVNDLVWKIKSAGYVQNLDRFVCRKCSIIVQ